MDLIVSSDQFQRLVLERKKGNGLGHEEEYTKIRKAINQQKKQVELEALLKMLPIRLAEMFIDGYPLSTGSIKIHFSLLYLTKVEKDVEKILHKAIKSLCHEVAYLKNYSVKFYEEEIECHYIYSNGPPTKTTTYVEFTVNEEDVTKKQKLDVDDTFPPGFFSGAKNGRKFQ